MTHDTWNLLQSLGGFVARVPSYKTTYPGSFSVDQFHFPVSKWVLFMMNSNWWASAMHWPHLLFYRLSFLQANQMVGYSNTLATFLNPRKNVFHVLQRYCNRRWVPAIFPSFGDDALRAGFSCQWLWVHSLQSTDIWLSRLSKPSESRDGCRSHTMSLVKVSWNFTSTFHKQSAKTFNIYTLVIAAISYR